MTMLMIPLMWFGFVPRTNTEWSLGLEVGMMAIQTFAGAAGIFSIVMMIRGNRNYFWFSVINLGTIFIINISIGLWMGAIEMLLQLALAYRAYLKWGKPKATKKITKASNKDWIITLGILGAFTLVGFLMANYTNGSPFETTQTRAYIDSILVGVAMVHLFLAAEKRRESQLIQFISTVATAVFFGLLGQWMIFTIVCMFIVPSLSGVASWYIKYETGEEVS